MKTSVKIIRSDDELGYKIGETGYIDGYIYTNSDGCLAVVVIKESNKIWCIPICHIKPIT